MSHSGHGGDTTGPACKISMLWNWYTIDACFLSSSWHITTNGAFAATCIGVVLMVILLEGLRRAGREYDEYIQRDFAARVALIANGGISGGVAQQRNTVSVVACPAGGNGPAASQQQQPSREALAPQTVTFRASPLQQLVRSLIHTATFGLAYIVMLLAMYYNGYVIFSILIGALLGKFVCDWLTRTVTIHPDGGALIKDSNSNGIEEPTVCCG